jgi:hypothetical protein
MKTNWKSMAASLAVLVGISGVAFGQDRDDHHDGDKHVRVENHDRDHDRDNRDPYDGRVFVPDNHRVYDADRYRDQGRAHDRDRVVYNGCVYNGGVYSPYDGYGNLGYYGGGNASRIGYQDGLNDGRSDRLTGHSFRPTQDDNFKNATRGYSSAFGDKQAYKDSYRLGYEKGYEQGYR